MASIGFSRAQAREIRRVVRDAIVAFLAFTILGGSIGGESSQAAHLGAIPAPPATMEGKSGSVVGAAPLLHRGGVAIGPLPAPARAEVHGPLFRGTDWRTAFYLLAAVFSAVVAFNLAFVRHLARVYASPRRGAWRGGEVSE